MSEPIFMFDDQDAQMQQAYAAARASFKYFWRELSWERRRIVPALDMSMVKIPFTDGPRTDGRPAYEQMWVGEIEFDGEELFGTLLNSPHWLTSVKEGITITAPLTHLTDWMMTVDGKAYGGFTVNLMRARMSRAERQQHDDAWGLDFGDPSTIRIELREPPGGSASGAFHDHPMCTNSLSKIEEQLRQNPEIASSTDDCGWTILHTEALAGNFGVVRLLVRYGADVSAKDDNGRDAATLARAIGWREIADYLDGLAKGA